MQHIIVNKNLSNKENSGIEDSKKNQKMSLDDHVKPAFSSFFIHLILSFSRAARIEESQKKREKVTRESQNGKRQGAGGRSPEGGRNDRAQGLDRQSRGTVRA